METKGGPGTLFELMSCRAGEQTNDADAEAALSEKKKQETKVWRVGRTADW